MVQVLERKEAPTQDLIVNATDYPPSEGQLTSAPNIIGAGAELPADRRVQSTFGLL